MRPLTRPLHDAASGLLASIQAREAIRRLAESGVPVSPMKGALLQHWAYDDPAERPMGDVDLLVPSERFSEALDLLARIGYRPLTTRADRFKQGYLKEVQLARPNSLMLELHHGLAAGRGADALARRLFSNETGVRPPFPIPGAVLPTVEQCLVSLALHYREHKPPFFPHQYEDVRRVVARLKPDPSTAFLLASEVGASVPLALLLDASGVSLERFARLLPASVAWKADLVRDHSSLHHPGEVWGKPSRIGRILWYAWLSHDDWTEAGLSLADAATETLREGARLIREVLPR